MDNWGPFKSTLQIQTPSDTFQSHIQMAKWLFVPQNQNSNGQNQTTVRVLRNRVALISLLIYTYIVQQNKVLTGSQPDI